MIHRDCYSPRENGVGAGQNDRHAYVCMSSYFRLGFLQYLVSFALLLVCVCVCMCMCACVRLCVCGWLSSGKYGKAERTEAEADNTGDDAVPATFSGELIESVKLLSRLCKSRAVEPHM
jgi:hypothetical protein